MTTEQQRAEQRNFCRVVLKVTLFLVGCVLLFIAVVPCCFDVNLFKGFKTGDAEVMTMVGYILAKGGKLYQDFYSPYGPFRSLVLAILTRWFGFSIPVFHAYWLFVQMYLAPLAVGVLTYQLGRRIFSEGMRKYSALIGCGSGLLSLMYIRGAQEQHVATMLFLLLLGPAMNPQASKWRLFAVGFGLGLIFFIRIEVGLMVGTALVLYSLFTSRKHFVNRQMIAGFLAFCVGYLLLIAFDGNLRNFFHDCIYSNLLVQTGQIHVPIDPHLAHVARFAFALNLYLLVVVLSHADDPALGVLAIVNYLFFMPVLFRGDGMHFFYGVALVPTLIPFGIYYQAQSLWRGSGRVSFVSAGLLVLALVGVHVLFARESMPWLMFILLATLICLRLLKRRWRILEGFAALLLLCSFGYLRPPMALCGFLAQNRLGINLSPHRAYEAVVNFRHQFQRTDLFGGQIIPAEDYANLLQMRDDLRDKRVFIFPSHATLYYELNQRPPVRYLYYDGERSPQMQAETIAKLEATDIRYVLFFEPRAQGAKGSVYDFILANYQEVKQYRFDQNTVHLKERRP